MNFRPPGTLRVLALLARTTLLRQLRAARIAKARRAAATRGKRQPTQRKRGDLLLWGLMLLMIPFFLVQATLISTRAASQLGVAVRARSTDGEALPVHHRVYFALQETPGQSDEEILAMLDREGVSDDSSPSRHQILARYREAGLDQLEWESVRVSRLHSVASAFRPAAEWRSPEARAIYARCGALLLIAIVLAISCSAFGAASVGLTGTSWTTPWLMTFPVSTRSLVSARFLEYSLVQFLPWFVLCPMAWQLLRVLGQPGALLLAVGLTLQTLLLVGGLRLWLETRLRLRCSLHTLRSVQGACTLLGLLFLMGVFAFAFGPAAPAWLAELGRVLPDVITWTPVSWVLGVPSYGLWPLLVGLALSAAIVWMTFAGTVKLLSRGSMAGGGVDAGKRGAAVSWRQGRALGVVRKDLALLLRDRNFLVQTVLAPALLIGLQLMIQPGVGHVGSVGFAMISYGIGAYTLLIGGCAQILSAEGRALWMLFSLPVPLAEALRRKVRIWAALAIGFAWIALFAFRARAGELSPGELVADALLVAFGVFCAAHIAAAIGVIGCNPTSDHVPRGIKARYVYLGLLLTGLFVGGLAAPDLPSRIGSALVFGLLSYAIWQRASDRLAFVLDPVQSAPPRVGVLDGAVALVLFFLVQSLALVILCGGVPRAEELALSELFGAFAIAGTVALALTAIWLSVRGVGVGAQLGLLWQSRRRALGDGLLGVVAGVAIGMIGLGYLGLVRRYGWFELPEIARGDFATALFLAVLAAPLVEEWLFRGLLFGGLARSLRPAVAILWSSAVFAAVHPISSWPPVFLMGGVAALVYHRTRWLPAAMLVHGAYNFVVVAFGQPW